MKRVLSAIIAVIILVSCQAFAADGVSFVLLCDSADGYYCSTVRQAFEQASREMEFGLTVDVTTEGRGIMGMLAHYVNTDAAAVFVAEEAYASLYPFHLYNDSLDLDTGTWYNSGYHSALRIEGFDPEAVGKALAEKTACRTEQTGDVIVLAEHPEDETQDKLAEAIVNALNAGKPHGENGAEVRWVSAKYDDYRDAYIAVQNIISENTELKGIVALSPTLLEGAAMCLNDCAMADKTELVGIGIPSVMAEYIQNGVCDGMYIVDAAWMARCMACVSASQVSGKRCAAMEQYASEGDFGAYGGHRYETVYTGDAIYVDAANIAEWENSY